MSYALLIALEKVESGSDLTTSREKNRGFVEIALASNMRDRDEREKEQQIQLIIMLVLCVCDGKKKKKKKKVAFFNRPEFKTTPYTRFRIFGGYGESVDRQSCASAIYI